ncbi:MAG: alpha-1,4-glucan--maltose-1-phosphate maltosyltransferase, partial [Armatimonadota bacterium]|nr:alpha-1,4-glucan--maltose-1-phosphate maltosyltransferase [Armatimonadota bacterium]
MPTNGSATLEVTEDQEDQVTEEDTAQPEATLEDEPQGQVEEGRQRVVIEAVRPQIEGGRYPIKRTVGEKVVVEADMFTDGHDAISGALLYRNESDVEWREAPLESLVNDRWRGEFTVSEVGRCHYAVQGWVDHFKTWRRDFRKRVDAGQDVSVDLLVGVQHLRDTAARATSDDARQLEVWAATLESELDVAAKTGLALAENLAQLMERYPDKGLATVSPELVVKVDREKARFSAWYEMFPRSCSPEPGRHGTFADCEARLPYIAEMGFDVLYFPPIHPIGMAHRKGPNNALIADPDDVGSPWAIGGAEGGHKDIHSQLGTLEDFQNLVWHAGEFGIDVALDIAFQCSPDHPYVKEHPQWFRHRPDGTIQYAENPPKKYQDIYPFDFETEDWQALWDELTSVVLYWVDKGVRIFRVDNPHTKPFPFWEYLIGQVHKEHPDVIFLAEAFTRPKVMYNLAKLGFTQSYTYFAWRNTKWDLTEYFTELCHTEAREFFRPNPWPNTPDILNEYLQFGGRPAFMARLVLAATLSPTYGIYSGYEWCENVPVREGSEEYL